MTDAGDGNASVPPPTAPKRIYCELQCVYTYSAGSIKLKLAVIDDQRVCLESSVYLTNLTGN